MIKAQWIKILSFKKSPFNWLNWMLVVFFFGVATFNIYYKGFTGYDFATLLIGTSVLIDALTAGTPTWYLRAPNQTMTNLYKVDDKYVAASTHEEAQLWAYLAGKETPPDKIGEVYHFEQ